MYDLKLSEYLRSNREILDLNNLKVPDLMYLKEHYSFLSLY